MNIKQADIPAPTNLKLHLFSCFTSISQSLLADSSDHGFKQQIVSLKILRQMISTTSIIFPFQQQSAGNITQQCFVLLARQQTLMQIQLISNTSFFEIFVLPSKQHFTGLIPLTIICDEGNIHSWLFNSQKQPHHPILRKNKENLFTIKFIKQLIASLNCYELVQEATSVAEIHAALMADVKKEDSIFKEYVNHTVSYCERKDRIPKYMKVLDFIKSLSNRSFNEPQCPEGWCSFQEVVLSRMKLNESYFVEVYKLEGDMTFRFNYYKWINKHAGKEQFSEPPFYQIAEHKEIIKIYEQGLTQKMLITVLQLISYLENNFRLEVKRLVARYTFNKSQDPVLKGVSQLKVVAPRKFVQYNKVLPDLTYTLLEYLEIEKKLQKLPDIIPIIPSKVEKSIICPGSFCNSILKQNSQSLEIGAPCQTISWSVIQSHSNPQIIQNLIEIGLIDIPNYSEQRQQPKAKRSGGEMTKVCNKCSLVYKAIIKIEKAETDFESKQLKRFSSDYVSESLKRSYNSKSSVVLKKNHIQSNISVLKSPPRGSYLNFSGTNKLPSLNTSRDKANKSSIKALSTNKKINNKSECSTPFLERYQNKPQGPLLKCLVGQKFKSKQELKDVLYKHFQKKKESQGKGLKESSRDQKERVSEIQRQEDVSRFQTEEQILDKIENLIGHHQDSEVVKNQKQKDLLSLTNKVRAQLPHLQSLEINVNNYEADSNMELNYCVLSHKQGRANKVLFILHDAISSYLQYLTMVASLVSEDLTLVLFNYPGQAYTSFGSTKLSAINFSEIMDRLIWHLDSSKVIGAQSDSLLFCGIGYGGYMLKYYLNMNYRYYSNWGGVLLINSASSISAYYQRFCKKLVDEKLKGPKLDRYYKEYYRIQDDLLPYCREYNQISEQGMVYLIKSTMDQQNEEVAIRSSKLRVVDKEISFNLDAGKSNKPRSLSKSPLPKSYPILYNGKESANYSLVTSPKFSEVLQKFIVKSG